MIFTIGYEGASISDFISTLLKAGVEHVMDVRELPQSRRPGFSKTVLASALTDAGISYSHVRQLGDPKPGREAARRGDMAEFRRIFDAHLALPLTQEKLLEASETVQSQVTALMCFERDPRGCHRSLVAKHLEQLCSLSVRHLGVVEHAAKRNRITAKAA